MRNESNRKKGEKTAALLLALCFTGFLLGPGGTRIVSGAATAEAQEYVPDELFSPEQLDNLLAPIALYPDPLLAQVLVAATFVDQVDDAARWMRAYNAPYGIDDRPWDVSVKAVAHYPSVLFMMSDRIDWTTAVGQAYVNQSTDVMASIQHLRALAYAAGNLISNQQQQVIPGGDYIGIVPYQPQVIYVPTYDPDVVYASPGSYFGFYPATLISFGAAFPIGAWLNRDCDWGGRRIYYHGWRGGGWIARSRSHVGITNVYVNNNYRNIQINRNVVRRNVNYANLNRYTSVHREVTYNIVDRGHRRENGNPNTGNRLVRRNPDVGNPRFDTRGGQSAIEQGTAQREQRPPQRWESRSALTREAKPPQPWENRMARTWQERAPQGWENRTTRTQRQIPSQPWENRMAGAREKRPPQVKASPPPRNFQPPPRSAFGGDRSVDPRAAGERGQFSRSRAQQPVPSAHLSTPRPQGERRERPERSRQPERERSREAGQFRRDDVHRQSAAPRL